MTAELTEVREYPRDEDPLGVALWRDQTLTLAEHRAALDGLMDRNLAEIQLRTARANLAAAERVVRNCEAVLARFA